MSIARLLCGLFMAATVAPAALAAVAYDETISGDLSNTGTTATPLSFAAGSNEVLGRIGRVSGVVDRDYFTFTVAPGFQFTALNVLTGTTALGQSFIGLQAGTAVTVDPLAGTAEGLLGWTLYGDFDEGIDILPRMGVPSVGSSGFTPPLPAGSYAVWIQETATGNANYRFEFLVTAVPEPSTALFLLAGLAGVGLVKRRQRTV